MHWNRWSNVLSLGLVGLMVACGGKEVPPAVAASAGAPPARPAGWPEKGTYIVDSRSLRLSGFFRPDACYANPSEQVFVPGKKDRSIADIASAIPAGTRLEEEYWVNLPELSKATRAARPVQASPASVLSCKLAIDADGRMRVGYVGASQGLMAMRGSRATPGEVMRCHAVEADSRQPVQFVFGGVPAAKPGSLTLLFEHFLSDDVAQDVTVEMEGSQNLLVVEVDAEGGILIYPGAQTG